MTTENISSASSSQSTFAIGFTVPTDTSEIQVYVEDASTGEMTLQTAGTDYNIVGTEVVFVSGNEPPAGTDNVQILRNTDVTSASKQRTFVAGSSIRAADLNANFTRLFDHAEDKIQTSDIANKAVTTAKIALGAVTTNRIAGSAVTTNKINASAVTAAKIGTDAVTSTKIQDNAVTSDKLASQAVTSNKIASDAVIQGKLADGAVSSAKIANQAVITNKINPLAVTTGKINDQAVTTAKLADNAITSQKIANGAIVNADVNASAAIAGTKISPNFGSQDVTTSGTITTTGNEITVQGNSPRFNFIDNNADDFYIEANGNDLTIHHFNSNIGISPQPPEKIRISTSTTTVKNNLDAESGVDVTGNITVTGTVDGRDVGADGTKLDGIATNADVTSTKNIGDLANVNTSGVADGKILKYQASSSSFIIADDATGGNSGVSTFTGLSDTPANFSSSASKVLKVNSAGNAVEFTDIATANIQDSAITTAKIATSAVTSNKINALAVTTAKINNDAVTNAKIADNAVTTAKIADDSVTGDKLSNNLIIPDNNTIKFGSDQDLQITHNGNNSHIKQVSGATGQLYIDANGDKNIILRAGNGLAGSQTSVNIVSTGQVALYFDGTKKFETVSDGVNVFNGNLKVSQPASTAAQININCASKSQPLRLEQNATEALIQAAASQPLTIRSQSGSGSSGYIRFYTKDDERLRITAAGDVKILNDTGKFVCGAGSDLELYHDGSNSYLKNTTGTLFIKASSGRDGIEIRNNGKVALFHVGVEKFRTTATGTATEGIAVATGEGTVGFKVPDSPIISNEFTTHGMFIAGTGDDLTISHNGTDSVIQNNTGNLNINAKSGESGINVVRDGAVELYYDGAKKFETTSMGAKIEKSGNAQLHLINTNTGGVNHVVLGLRSFTDDGDTKVSFGTSSSGNRGELKYVSDQDKFQWRVAGGNRYVMTSTEFSPLTNNNRALGNSTNKWSTLHSGALNTGDIHMNNLDATSGNEVDGTKGSWSLQEGADDLFLINRVSGKKYKFNITEIS